MELLGHLFSKYSRISRREKVKLFFQLMQPAATDTLLDLGGGVGDDFRELRNYFKEVLIVDINESAMKDIRQNNNKWLPLVGDGCYVPLKDKSVDFVFSNAVIEHVRKDKRKLFAQEINRVVKKGYFVTTPNYWFPYEPHYKIPFWQYLPNSLKKAILAKVSVGHHKKGSYRGIPLLSSRELKNYFPRANIYYLKVTRFFIAEVICAYWRARDTHK